MTGGAIYAQIDDQLWDQMVALPLFGEPAFVANGVQMANVQYNPSVDGILWNVALWTTLKPGPADHRAPGQADRHRAAPECDRGAEASAESRYHASRPGSDTGATSSEWRNRQTR